MRQSESITKIGAALVKAAPGIGTVVKDKTAKIPTKSGGEYRYSYADLGSVLEACREPLAAQEIIVLQEATAQANTVRVVTRLLHSSGEWIESDPLEAKLENTADVKAIGSAITYLRRYSLMPMLGIAPEDDDGEAASKATAQRGVQQARDSGALKPASQLEPPKSARKSQDQQQDGSTILRKLIAELEETENGKRALKQAGVDSQTDLEKLSQEEKRTLYAELRRTLGEIKAGAA